MNTKQKTLALAFILGIGASLMVSAAPLYAAQCGGVDTSIIECPEPGGSDASVEQSGVWGILMLALNIMTAGVGILAVGGIVYGAILYTTSSDSQEQTKQAKDIIRNVAIGLLAYAGIYLFLNFLIPGGIFG